MLRSPLSNQHTLSPCKCTSTKMAATSSHGGRVPRRGLYLMLSPHCLGSCFQHTNDSLDCYSLIQCKQWENSVTFQRGIPNELELNHHRVPRSVMMWERNNIASCQHWRQTQSMEFMWLIPQKRFHKGPNPPKHENHTDSYQRGRQTQCMEGLGSPG